MGFIGYNGAFTLFKTEAGLTLHRWLQSRWLRMVLIWEGDHNGCMSERGWKRGRFGNGDGNPKTTS